MAEQIETAEELDALPMGSIVRGDNGQPWVREYRAFTLVPTWHTVRSHGAHDAAAAGLLPATILYRPDAPAPSDEDREALAAELERFRQHSVLLNALSWRIAVAVGDVPEGADRIEGDPDEQLTRLIALAARSSQPPSAEDPEALAWREAVQAYPTMHVGYGKPIPDGCRCDECYRREDQRNAYMAGRLAARSPQPSPSVNAEQAEASVCGWKFPFPGWAGEDQMDPCTCDLPAGHPPTDDRTKHSCQHIRGEVTP